jgi:hypothetical protein
MVQKIRQSSFNYEANPSMNMLLLFGTRMNSQGKAGGVDIDSTIVLTLIAQG